MRETGFRNLLETGFEYGKTGGWVLQEEGPGYRAPVLNEKAQRLVERGHDRKMFVSL